MKKQRAITDIGLDYGYSSSNFSSAFRHHHSISPTEFRKYTETTCISNPFDPGIVDHFETFDKYDSGMRIVLFQDMQVIYERVYGNYGGLKEKWLELLDTYEEYIKDNTLMIDRFYNDPTISSQNSCMCDLCITAENTCKLENITTIKGGKFATYRFEGEIKDIFRVLQGIFAVWFPKSGYEMDEKYGLNIYQEIDRGTSCVIMDLCIPVK